MERNTLKLFHLFMEGKMYKILADSIENYNLNIHINQYSKSSKHPYPHG